MGAPMELLPGKQVDTSCDDALADHDTVGLLAELAARRVHPRELIDAALARADRAEPDVNAVTIWLGDPQPADGPFGGVPSFLKDNENLAGYATTQGSLAVSPQTWRESTAFPAQYQQLGFTLLGKTTLPEFGLTPTTESSGFGATRNPWNLGRSTGGSSGGSAALVAAGVVPIAHANDGGGSIRIPASCCGLVGLMPTRGRLVPVEGMDQLPIAFATQGVVTRTVRDTALFYSEAEKVYRSRDLPPLEFVEGPGRRRLRIGLFDVGFRGQPVDEATRTAIAETGLLCELLGHTVTPIDFPYPDSYGPDFLRYWSFLGWGLGRFGGRLYGKGFDRRKLEEFTVGLGRHFRSSAERLPMAIRRLRRFGHTYGRHFERFDVLLSPVLAHEPPPIGYLGPDVPYRTHLIRLVRYATQTSFQNIAGAPAISLPLGRSATGVPIGMQFAGAVGDERTLLELAYELEEARPWQRTPNDRVT